MPSFLCDNINKFFNCLEISDEFVKKSLSWNFSQSSLVLFKMFLCSFMSIFVSWIKHYLSLSNTHLMNKRVNRLFFATFLSASNLFALRQMEALDRISFMPCWIYLFLVYNVDISNRRKDLRKQCRRVKFLYL